ncbi:MAG: IscA/HesB family protein [Deltaproteobacteria bacterium]|jgi:Fe-S cluster assembly iron-binding protein IscA|nr:IscA/HesB family protein [Deltaproteobacteria bacterium]
MLTISENAVKELDSFFSDKEKSPIRVYLAGGCGGPRLSLALDAPGDEDISEEASGYTFCMEKILHDQTGEISVDLSAMGFSVDSVNPMGGGCGSGCGGCGGGCGSH